MGHIGKAVAVAGKVNLHYGKELLAEVTPAIFARLPVMNGKAVNCNHAAWVYGHLFFASSLMNTLGSPKINIVVPPAYEELFNNKSVCKDDPAGTIYPAMETLVSQYQNAYSTILAALPEIGDDVFERPNPLPGRLGEIFPTLGSLTTFIMVGHTMLHIGQYSTWRRCMGLSPANT